MEQHCWPRYTFIISDFFWWKMEFDVACPHLCFLLWDRFIWKLWNEGIQLHFEDTYIHIIQVSQAFWKNIEELWVLENQHFCNIWSCILMVKLGSLEFCSSTPFCCLCNFHCWSLVQDLQDFPDVYHNNICPVFILGKSVLTLSAFSSSWYIALKQFSLCSLFELLQAHH